MKKNIQERPRQETPRDMVDDLMQAIRSGFYGDNPDKWFQDQRFILQNVVSWPARWLNQRGVTLPPDRYKEILLAVFQDIKRNCRQTVVKYWPGYLAHCVQEHFAHHGEEYYQEGKSLRAAAERALMAFQRKAEANQADQVARLADVNQILSRRRPAQPKPAEKKSQLNLF